ncbi:hypothetical protein FTM27_02310 [Chlamydia trachomatis]|nr:hypothetical protein FTM27_02310 [Chlamydia trachomatis]
MPHSPFLYVVQPHSVFNPRLGERHPITLDFIKEKNRLADFIENLPLEIFGAPSFLENASLEASNRLDDKSPV